MKEKQSDVRGRSRVTGRMVLTSSRRCRNAAIRSGRWDSPGRRRGETDRLANGRRATASDRVEEARERTDIGGRGPGTV